MFTHWFYLGVCMIYTVYLCVFLLSTNHIQPYVKSPQCIIIPSETVKRDKYSIHTYWSQKENHMKEKNTIYDILYLFVFPLFCVRILKCIFRCVSFCFLQYLSHWRWQTTSEPVLLLRWGAILVTFSYILGFQKQTLPRLWYLKIVLISDVVLS